MKIPFTCDKPVLKENLTTSIEVYRKNCLGVKSPTFIFTSVLSGSFLCQLNGAIKILTRCKNEREHGRTIQMTYAPSEDSDQPGHLPSLISLHCLLEEALVRGYPLYRVQSTGSNQTGQIFIFTGCTGHFLFCALAQMVISCDILQGKHCWGLPTFLYPPPPPPPPEKRSFSGVYCFQHVHDSIIPSTFNDFAP